MTKHILSITFMLAALCGFSITASASNTGIEIVQADFNDITVYIQGSTLHVAGAAGLDLYIYNITGVRVMSIKVDGSDRSYNLNLPKGCYIVKVGNVVRKISIK